MARASIPNCDTSSPTMASNPSQGTWEMWRPLSQGSLICSQGAVHPAQLPLYSSHSEWRGKCQLSWTLPWWHWTHVAQTLVPAGQVDFKRASAPGSKYLGILLIWFSRLENPRQRAGESGVKRPHWFSNWHLLGIVATHISNSKRSKTRHSTKTRSVERNTLLPKPPCLTTLTVPWKTLTQTR